MDDINFLVYLSTSVTTMLVTWLNSCLSRHICVSIFNFGQIWCLASHYMETYAYHVYLATKVDQMEMNIDLLVYIPCVIQFYKWLTSHCWLFSQWKNWKSDWLVSSSDWGGCVNSTIWSNNKITNIFNQIAYSAISMQF